MEILGSSLGQHECPTKPWQPQQNPKRVLYWSVLRLLSEVRPQATSVKGVYYFDIGGRFKDVIWHFQLFIILK